jgi:hypothetical protein
MGLFKIDDGAFYETHTDGEGVLHVVGIRTRTDYASPRNAVEVTGKRRQHVGVGVGCRAVLTLDTGDAVVTYRGVYRDDH